MFLLDKSVEVFDLVAGGGRSESRLWRAGLCALEVPAASCSPGTLLEWYGWLFSKCIWRNARTEQQTGEGKPGYNSSIFLLSNCRFCNIHLCANALALSLPFQSPFALCVTFPSLGSGLLVPASCRGSVIFRGAFLPQLGLPSALASLK